MSETNYERYFGTPEKAAKTAISIAWSCSDATARKSDASCERCLVHGHCHNSEALAEWLESEAK